MEPGHHTDISNTAYFRHVYDSEEIKRFRRERAAGGDETAFRKYFRRDLHAGLVRNLRKVGVLTPRIAPDLESLGISLAAAA
jgi:hypothetical protein